MRTSLSTPALRAFRHRNFRLFFAGQGVSMIGTWVQQIAQAWLVYRLTGSPLMLGLTTFAAQIPILFLAPLGGLLSDRVDRRKLLLATQAVLMLQALSLAGLTLSGAIEAWHVIGLALVYGVAMGLDTPLRQSLLIALVGERSDLPNAIALNSLLMNASRMLGPSVAGVLLALMSEGWCFLINAASYTGILLAVAAWGPLTPNSSTAARFPAAAGPCSAAGGAWPGSARAVPLLHGLKEGFVYAWTLLPIRVLLPLLALLSFAASPYVSLMPVIAREVLGGDSRTLGFLVGGAGLGALIGTSWLAARGTARGLESVIAVTAALAGGALVLFSLSRVFWLSLPLIVLVGFGIIVTAASINTIVQTIVADDKRGRVMSFYTMAFLGVAPLGALGAGALASLIGAPATLRVGGCACLLGAALFARVLPRLRQSLTS